MGMVKEFREFAMKGNVVDMAVGIVIGAAFGKIVSSFVEKIIMPLVGLVTGGVDFAKYNVTLKEAVTQEVDGKEEVVTPALELGLGAFLTVIVDFVIVAFAIFIAVKAMNTLRKRFEEQEEEKPKEPSEEVKLLSEIRDSLSKG